MIAAILVAVAALVVVLGIAAVRQGRPEQQPVPIAAVPAPRADSPECRALLAALPEVLGDFRRAPTAEPTPGRMTRSAERMTAGSAVSSLRTPRRSRAKRTEAMLAPPLSTMASMERIFGVGRDRRARRINRRGRPGDPSLPA